MNFNQYLPTRLITGRGCVRASAVRFSGLGKKCMIVTSKTAAMKCGALTDVAAALNRAKVRYVLYDKVDPNPSLSASKRAGDMARDFGAEFIVGIGGGSALDAAKAVAVFAVNDMDAMDIYKPGWKAPLPIALVGTTAGTGSEVSPATVMTTPDGKKKSITNERLYARIAFCDPAYTDTLPLEFTVSTALDALSHAMEGYFATSANELSDLYAREAVKILVPHLTALKSLEYKKDVSNEMRDQLQYASILAGFTLAKCGTCYCHTLSYFLTEQYGVSHGSACAALLPDFIRRQTRLLPEKAQRLYAEAGCTADSLYQLIEGLNKCPRVTLEVEEIDRIVTEGAATKNFARTAPDGYTTEEARELLTRMFGA